MLVYQRVLGGTRDLCCFWSKHVGKRILHHPPVMTMFIGGIMPKWVVEYCCNHIMWFERYPGVIEKFKRIEFLPSRQRSRERENVLARGHLCLCNSVQRYWGCQTSQPYYTYVCIYYIYTDIFSFHADASKLAIYYEPAELERTAICTWLGINCFDHFWPIT